MTTSSLQTHIQLALIHDMDLFGAGKLYYVRFDGNQLQAHVILQPVLAQQQTWAFKILWT
jgi:hypothetical protein